MLTKLPQKVQARIEAAITAYATTGKGDVKKLAGSGAYRLRVGDYRIIFDRTAREIDILDIGHRKEVYR